MNLRKDEPTEVKMEKEVYKSTEEGKAKKIGKLPLPNEIHRGRFGADNLYHIQIKNRSICSTESLINAWSTYFG